MTTLVTGAAGFIGFHVAKALLDRGDRVVGLDSINDYYDPTLKRARLGRIEDADGFSFVKRDLADRDGVAALYRDHGVTRVIHLAAQAGVRYSLTNPQAYIDSNIIGFQNIIDAARDAGVEHLTYASSSSVYGLNRSMPFAVGQNVDHPASLYAATKKSNELVAHCYSHLYGLPTTGLRFFTVYGPWGRPDMALFIFTKKILDGEPIQLFNHGNHKRDFTYIDDIVEGVVRVSDTPAAPDPAFDPEAPDPSISSAPYRLYNIGNNKPVALMDYVRAIEASLGRTAEKEYLPMQKGDVPETFADVDALEQAVGFRPTTPIEEGVRRFVEWYRGYNGR